MYIQNLYLNPVTTQFVIIRKVGLKVRLARMFGVPRGMLRILRSMFGVPRSVLRISWGMFSVPRDMLRISWVCLMFPGL